MSVAKRSSHPPQPRQSSVPEMIASAPRQTESTIHRDQSAGHAAERHFRTLIEQIPAITYIADADSINSTLYVSPQVEDLLGFPSSAWTSDPEFWLRQVYPEDRARVLAAAQAARMSGQPFVAEYRMLTNEGRIVWFRDEARTIYDDDGRAVFCQGVMLDITAQKQSEEARQLLEQNLIQAQKLESLGVLAGGVAHDFNNLLSVILGNVGLLLREVDPRSFLYESLDQVEQAAQRATNLTQQLLAYAGRKRVAVRPVDLNTLAQEMDCLLRASTPKTVELVYRLDAEMPLIEADATQMRQVLMNLVVNAAEAIGDQPGRVTIATCTRTIVPDEWQLRSGHEPQPHNQYVLLEVSDTGSGIDPTILARIFEPFFSTKLNGRGLGLAAVQWIVRGHRGLLDVHSVPGAGAIFAVFIPALDERTL